MSGKEGDQMLSAMMAIIGLFLMSTDSVPIVLIGLGLLGFGAYIGGAFGTTINEETKRKESCHRPK